MRRSRATGAGCILPRLADGVRCCALCRAEKSFTHRHLCEFTGLDFEMTINQHYNEVLDMLDHLFVYMFNGLKKHCGALFAAAQYQQDPVPSCLSSHICTDPIIGRTPCQGCAHCSVSPVYA